MTSPDRTRTRRIDVTLMRGIHVTPRPGRDPLTEPGPFDDEVEIFRAEPGWFAPWVDEVDLGELGFLRREAPPRRRSAPLPFQLARRILRDAPMEWEVAPRETGFVAHLNGTAHSFGFSPGMYIGRTVAHGHPVQIMADEFATRFRPIGSPADERTEGLG